MPDIAIRKLSASELITLWEGAWQVHPLVRPLHMLAICQADPSRADPRSQDSLATLDIAERNRHLMELFITCYGSRLEWESRCPSCDESVEVVLDLRRVLAERTEGVETDRSFLTAFGSFRVSFRLPNTRDLLALRHDAGAGRAQKGLVRACIAECSHDGRAIAVADAPDEVLMHTAEQMGQCDPHAEILVRLACPECGAQWRLMLDIAEQLWRKVAVQAKALARTVHVLARAYAWSEADILTMSEARRALYLSMVDT